MPIGWRPADKETTIAVKDGEDVNLEAGVESCAHDRPVVHDVDSEVSSQIRNSLNSLRGSQRSENVMDAYSEMMKKLVEKRRAANRPERPLDMTLQEV